MHEERGVDPAALDALLLADVASVDRDLAELHRVIGVAR